MRGSVSPTNKILEKLRLQYFWRGCFSAPFVERGLRAFGVHRELVEMAGGGNFKFSIKGQIYRGYRLETVQENIEELLKEIDPRVKSDSSRWSGLMFICSWVGSLGDIGVFQRLFEKIKTSTGKYFQASVFDLVLFYGEREG